MAYSLSMYQAIAIVVFIALKTKENRFEYLTTKHICEILGIARPTAVKILQSLNTAGLIVTKEGAKGGILLAKPLDQITLYDIFVALEGDRPLFKTGVSITYDDCNRTFWDNQIELLTSEVDQSLLAAEGAMKDSLRQKTIEQIMDSVLTNPTFRELAEEFENSDNH